MKNFIDGYNDLMINKRGRLIAVVSIALVIKKKMKGKIKRNFLFFMC